MILPQALNYLLTSHIVAWFFIILRKCPDFFITCLQSSTPTVFLRIEKDLTMKHLDLLALTEAKYTDIFHLDSQSWLINPVSPVSENMVPTMMHLIHYSPQTVFIYLLPLAVSPLRC